MIEWQLLLEWEFLASNDVAVTKWSIHLRRRASVPATGSKQRTVAGFLALCLPTKIDKLPLVFEWARNGDGGANMPTPLIPDMAVSRESLPRFRS